MVKITRVLIVSVRYGKESTGGAALSFKNVINGLEEIKNIEIHIFARTTKKLIKKFLDPLGFSYYIYLFKIYSIIKKFKPNIILTQSRITFAAILAAKLAKVPIIALIRDVSDVCPKHIDIIKYGVACKGLENRKICYKCIDNWRSLRVLIKNKYNGWQNSFPAIFSSLIYKLRFFSTKFNLKILNKAERVVVASKLMKSILSYNIDKEKIKILNITPIIEPYISKLTKEKQFLFVIPSYEASHKGLDFIIRLSKLIPNDYKILIVGGKLQLSELNTLDSRIINYGQVSKQELDLIYQKSMITLVPSFCTEAFGRIIIESILNYTPVISSPNCGANSNFLKGQFLKEVQINLSLWIKEIHNILENYPKITENDINKILEEYSIESSKIDFSKLIKQLVNLKENDKI